LNWSVCAPSDGCASENRAAALPFADFTNMKLLTKGFQFFLVPTRRSGFRRCKIILIHNRLPRAYKDWTLS
jgi:hypothetical protein